MIDEQFLSMMARKRNKCNFRIKPTISFLPRKWLPLGYTPRHACLYVLSFTSGIALSHSMRRVATSTKQSLSMLGSNLEHNVFSRLADQYATH